MQQNIANTRSGEKSGSSTPQKLMTRVEASNPLEWNQTEQIVKRKRGRPRKYPKTEEGELSKENKKMSPKKDEITKKVKLKKRERKNSLQSGMAVNINSKWGLEPNGDEFLRACQFGQTSTVKVMIRKGTKVNFIDRLSKNTGLHEAVASGHMEIVKLLLKHPETDLEAKNIHDQKPADMLEIIKDEKELRILSSLINEEVAFRKTLATHPDLRNFFRYLSEGNMRKAENFMENNAMIKYEGFYPVHVAAKYNQPELLRKFNVLHPDEEPLRGEDQATPLHVACRWSSTEAAQCLLLEIGANPFHKDTHGMVPSEYASAQCKELRKVFRKYAREHGITDPRIMIETSQRYIVDENESRNDTNPGRSILISQLKKGSSSQARKKYSKRKIFPLEESEESASPKKMIAMTREERKLQQVLGILERVDTSPRSLRVPKGAKANSPTVTTGASKLKRGPGRPRKYPRSEEEGEIQTNTQRMNQQQSEYSVEHEDPIYEPRHNSPVSTERKKRGRPRKDDQINRKGEKKLAKKVPPQETKKNSSNSNVNIGDPILSIDKGTQRTLLHKAAGRGNIIKAKELLEVAPELTKHKDNGGYHALHEAALKGHLDIVKLLIDHGAEVNVRAENGDTPLHDASENGHLSVVKLLLERGADPKIENADGLTPVDVSYDKVLDHFESKLDLHPQKFFPESHLKENGTEEIPKARAKPVSFVHLFPKKILGKKKSKSRKSKKEKKDKKRERSESDESSSLSSSLGNENQGKSAPLSPGTNSPNIKKGNETPINVKREIKAAPPEKILLINLWGAWHFLSPQIERFYETSLGTSSFADDNPSIYKGLRISSDEYFKILNKHTSFVDNNCKKKNCNEVELLEKEAVYTVFRRDGVPLGSIPVVFSDVQVQISDKANCNLRSNNKENLIMPPKMRFKYNGSHINAQVSKNV